ncbi:MAG: flagellar hook-basal body complex protein FliE [Vulcanimicrobiota bacterium]
MQSPFQSIQGITSGVSGIGTTGSPISGIGMPKMIEQPGQSEENGKAFGAVLAESLNTVNTTIDGSIKSTNNLLSGNMDGLHEMTIAGAKAEVMMKLTTTVVGKMAQATTQLFQMQL